MAIRRIRGLATPVLCGGNMLPVEAQRVCAAAAAAHSTSPIAEPQTKWFESHSKVFNYPLPAIAEIQSLQEIASRLFQILEKLPRRSQIPEVRVNTPLRVEWERWDERDRRILNVWGTTLERGWEDYQKYQDAQQASWWSFCCSCCCNEPLEGKQIEELKRASGTLSGKWLLSLSSSCLFKEVEEQTRERISSVYWRASHIHYLIGRAHHRSYPDKPCRFFNREYEIRQEQERRQTPQIKQYMYIGDFLESKVRYKLLVYVNYLMADLKDEMEALSRSLKPN